MTQDEQMDRLERSLRLFLNTPIHESRERREPRITAAKVGAYVKALKERDDAKDALSATPADPEAREILRKAEEILDRVRAELRR
jgi:hypothetical protein